MPTLVDIFVPIGIGNLSLDSPQISPRSIFYFVNKNRVTAFLTKSDCSRFVL